MVVGWCVVEIRLDGSKSLKDKRRVLKSLLTRLRKEFSLAAAEVGANDAWAVAIVGLACVSNERRHAESVLQRAVSWIDGNIEGEAFVRELDFR